MIFTCKSQIRVVKTVKLRKDELLPKQVALLFPKHAWVCAHTHACSQTRMGTCSQTWHAKTYIFRSGSGKGNSPSDCSQTGTPWAYALSLQGLPHGELLPAALAFELFLPCRLLVQGLLVLSKDLLTGKARFTLWTGIVLFTVQVTCTTSQHWSSQARNQLWPSFQHQTSSIN